MLRIINNPFYFIIRAFEELYPDKTRVVIQFVDMEHIDKESIDETGYGLTFFPDEENEPVHVYVDIKLQVKDAAEILAHELAHVAVGAEADHNELWEKSFDDIYKRSQNMYEQSLKSSPFEDIQLKSYSTTELLTELHARVTQKNFSEAI
ncbi:hypothetical protein ABE237_00730 [Brevibacillus formosus]|uniref:hypothetical protein n=1 Tax=Brevibacillus formosus TaxID=54913 RepID=UPI0018CD6371|nr:hypothetical protein [Brevibacillus formosus]